MTRRGFLLDLGRMEYGRALALQEQVHRAVLAGLCPDVLLLLEHPPVITTGAKGGEKHLLVSRETLTKEGIALFATSRGGDITYHGPGQIVGYPVMDLSRYGRDVHGYLRRLEEVLIRALADIGLEAGRVPGYTGVWVGDGKVAAIGVTVRQWVTMHGFALNVDPEMRHFSLIVPCGIRDHGVTSVATLTGRPVSPDGIRWRVAARFGEVFDLALVPVSLADLPAVQPEPAVAAGNGPT